MGYGIGFGLFVLAVLAYFAYDWRMHPVCSAIGKVGCGDNAATRRKNLFSSVVYCRRHNPRPGERAIPIPLYNN